jgi:hypothetical protein
LLSLCGTLFTLPSGLMLGMYLPTQQRVQQNETKETIGCKNMREDRKRRSHSFMTRGPLVPSTFVSYLRHAQK